MDGDTVQKCKRDGKMRHHHRTWRIIFWYGRNLLKKWIYEEAKGDVCTRGSAQHWIDILVDWWQNLRNSKIIVFLTNARHFIDVCLKYTNWKCVAHAQSGKTQYGFSIHCMRMKIRQNIMHQAKWWLLPPSRMRIKINRIIESITIWHVFWDWDSMNHLCMA